MWVARRDADGDCNNLASTQVTAVTGRRRYDLAYSSAVVTASQRHARLGSATNACSVAAGAEPSSTVTASGRACRCRPLAGRRRRCAASPSAGRSVGGGRPKARGRNCSCSGGAGRGARVAVDSPCRRAASPDAPCGRASPQWQGRGAGVADAAPTASSRGRGGRGKRGIERHAKGIDGKRRCALKRRERVAMLRGRAGDGPPSGREGRKGAAPCTEKARVRRSGER